MDYQRIYEYRFKDTNFNDKLKVWKEISSFLYKFMGKPKSILDPAAGMCEFINSFPAQEKWAVDIEDSVEKFSNEGNKTAVGNIFDITLDKNDFDAVFMSNFLEHLGTAENVSKLFKKLKKHLSDDRVVCIMGPNFKYCADDYFDCSDHTLILTHTSVEEILYASGYEIIKSHPKFLQFSFRGKLPPSQLVTKVYLKIKFFLEPSGKQFLILAKTD